MFYSGASAEDEEFRTDFLLMRASFRLTILLTGLAVFGSQQVIDADELLAKPESKNCEITEMKHILSKE